MVEEIKLYYSIENLTENSDLEDLLEINYNKSLNTYKTSLWGDNNIHLGELIIEEDNINRKIILNMNNNIYIEALYKVENCIFDHISNKININSKLYKQGDNSINESININIEHLLKDDNTYGILTLKGKFINLIK